MVKNLVIVESPAKAKTIEKFLGKDYLVKSSYGHVRDLAKKNQGVEIENDFKPVYEISADKKKVITELKKLAKEAETVWLASDEDREGEAIAWHLAEALKLKKEKTQRIVFHEITKPAITEAIKNPRGIDENLVDAQQARRVLDRLVGFELSPLLWRKVKPSLSAGRVQSVAVRLIVEREQEIKAFKPDSSYKVSALFIVEDDNRTYEMKAELPSRFKDEAKAKAFLEKAAESEFHIAEIEKKPGKKSPAPPFTTSTLQQEAARKLSFSVSKTMLIAQQLYESGIITYMRTDSTNLSKMALKMAQEEIVDSYGEKYSKTRQFASKIKGAQEAHESIRPTNLKKHTAGSTQDQKKLYDLIWKRTIASQMSDALLERTTVKIDVSKAKEQFIAKGEIIKFDGFLKVYLESYDDDEQEAEEQKGMLPPLMEGQELQLNQMEALQRFSSPPPRYSEASLVKKLEDLGIGRPSTYAPTISTIQKRQYVEKGMDEGKERKHQVYTLKNGKIASHQKTEKTGANKGKLIPTDIGTLVTQFLIEYFDNIMDYNFTAKVEKEFDEIARGMKEWNTMIKSFYNPFHKKVEETMETSDKVKGERLLGKDPKSGRNIYARIGRYGPMVQIGDREEDKKPQFAGLRKNQSIETITLEEALELFKFPRQVGTYEGEEVLVSIGRFGPYVKHKGKFVSLKKDDDPSSIDEERAIELIEEKREKDRNKYIKTFEDEDIQVLNGRWGPYISHKKKNYKIPKDKDAKELTLEDCKKIIKESGTKKKTTRKKKSK
ncbi:MAG: type I DNA topoisomerase [Bacteroidota bacterium]